MPVSIQSPPEPDDEDDEELEDEETESVSPPGSPMAMRRGATMVGGKRTTARPNSGISNDGTSSTLNSRPNSGVRSRPQSNISNTQRARSLSRLAGSNGKSNPLQRSTVVSLVFYRYVLNIKFGIL